MLNREKFEALMNKRSNILVSIYIPTYRAGNAEADHLRFKNALTEATNKLKEHGLEEKDARAFLRKGYDLLDQKDFWAHLSDGLAVFLSDDAIEYYLTPIDFNPMVYVAKNFYLRPLFPVISGEDRFFLLALSQNDVRFFEGDLFGITPVIIEDLVPADMEEALNAENERDNVQMHSGGGAYETPIYHGQDMGGDHKLKQLKRYFKQVDDGLMEMLHDEKAPLIIAAVDHYIPIYREVSRYNNITEVHIGGNPEKDDPALLHEKAWEIMKNFIHTHKQTIINKFDELIGTGKATYNLMEALPAAKDGKVEALFVHKDRYAWGQYNEEERKAVVSSERKKDDVELLNKIALDTYMKGGTVYTVEQEEMPQPTAGVCAIFRYG